MTGAIRWQRGDRSLQAELAARLADPSPPAVDVGDVRGVRILFDRPGRRRLLKVAIDDTTSLFVKQIRAPRFSAVSAFGLDAAAREWYALSRLQRAGLAVAEPVALGTLSNGDRVLATRFVDGVTLRDRLEQVDRVPAEHHEMLGAIGRLVHGFHRAGFVHRDLHWGNILLAKSGPVLLDLQAALRLPGSVGRRRDLGSLDYSVSPRLSIADRTRLCAAALGFDRPFGESERRALRAVGEASLAAGRAHAASRTRRSLRPGRQYASIRIGRDRGLRRREVSESEVAQLFAAAAAEPGEQLQVLKSDARARVVRVSTAGHSRIVKEYRAAGRSWLRRGADGFRGSPARRAWLGGHGLLARGIGSALPIAFTERRRFGLPLASAIVLEDLGGGKTADACAGDFADESEVLRAIERLVVALHRRGVVHGDLKASHVLLERVGQRVVGRLIDLEGVRFRRRLSDRQRIHSLAQLNASLPDEISNAGRLQAFERYTAAVPFRAEPSACLREIVAESLRRRHRWTGGDCALAARERTIIRER